MAGFHCNFIAVQSVLSTRGLCSDLRLVTLFPKLLANDIRQNYYVVLKVLGNDLMLLLEVPSTGNKHVFVAMAAACILSFSHITSY